MPPKRKSANSTRRNSTAITNDSPPILSDSSLEDIVLSQSPVKSKFFSSTKTNGVANTPNGKGKLTRSSTRTSTKSDQVNGNGKRKRVATSEEDSEQEEDDLTRETAKGSKNSSKRPSPTKTQKQVEEVETPPKGTATRNPSGRIPYVEVPRRVSGLSRTSSVTNVSQSSGTNSRRQSALESLARSRSRRTTVSTPASSEPPHTSDGEILTDDELQYKDPLESLSDDVESDESVSEFEDDSVSEGSGLDIGKMGLDDSDEASEISEVEFLKKNGSAKKKAPVVNKKSVEFKIGGSKFDLGKKASAFKTKAKNNKINGKPTVPPPKRGAKPTNGMDVDGEDEEGHGADTDDEMVRAAIRASYVTAAEEIRREFSSAGAGPSRSSNQDRMSMSVSPAKKTNGVSNGKKKSTAVESDSDDLPLVQKSKGRKGKKKQTIETIDLGDDDSDEDFRMAPRGDDSSADGSVTGDGMEIDEDEEDVEEDEDVVTAYYRRVAADKAAKAIQKQDEAKERKRLGRKLTYAEKSTIALYRHHPELKTVWGDLEKRAVIKPEKGVQPDGLKVKLLPFQLESITWMRKQESGVWAGGMLADEMGMGKTIQTLALFVSDRKKPNLIVAPTVAIMQWRNEIEEHTTDFNIYIFHGAARNKNIEELQKYDVVLTTYAVLESVFRKQTYGFKRKGQLVKEKSALHEIHWARIILDEAHNIKERTTNTARAAFQLNGTYKWCLSGTPLQNRVGELYSLVRFLGGDPFSYYFCKRCDCKSLHWKFSDKRSCDICQHPPTQHVCLWNNEILGPIQKHGLEGPGHDAFRKLRILLDRMMLRRTKLERADDLGLPPRTVIVRRDYFSPEEKELYLSLFSDAKRQFSTYVDSGTVLNNYSNIFTLITRMRQMACHPDLVLKSKRNVDLAGDIVETTVCRLCNDIAEDAIESKCHHVFDRECIKQYLDATTGTTPDCPVCHLPLSIDLEAEAIEISEDQVNKAKQGILGRLDLEEWRSSSKIEALIEELSNLRRQDRTIKSIVFSQFVNFLDLIAFRLKKAGFNICRLEGTMTPQARDLTIKHFMNNVEVTVFLVSLKAGGVALNLTEASRVYLMDSWWNPAVEFQAMDRIHRLGQHRPVQAIKLVIEDSIESRIIQLQEKKSAMVDATLSTDDSAMGRLTPEDLGFLFRL